MTNKVHLELLFDLRCPNWVKIPKAELYKSAIEMCSWAEGNGFESVTLAEHHMVDDQYLSSPLLMASAVASRTERLALRLILVAPFYNPLRLAEDLHVVQILSEGRVVPVITGGYRQPEFDMYGVRREDRLGTIEEAIAVIRASGSGKPFNYRGRTIDLVSPVPDVPLRLLMGPSFPKTARRAAHLEVDGISPTSDLLFDLYRDELTKLGKPDPGPFPAASALIFIHVSRDPERAWEQVGPHLLHNTRSYRAYAGSGRGEAVDKQAGDDSKSVNKPKYLDIFKGDSIPELKENPHFLITTPEGLLEKISSMGPDTVLKFQPLLSGLNPELGWECLKLLKEEVMPHLEVVTNFKPLY